VSVFSPFFFLYISVLQSILLPYVLVNKDLYNKVCVKNFETNASPSAWIEQRENASTPLAVPATEIDSLFQLTLMCVCVVR